MKSGKTDTVNKIFFSVAFVLMFFISCIFTPGLALGKGGAVYADLLFCMSIVMGILYDNRRAASVIALVFGVISDVFLTPAFHLSPLVFFVAAYFASVTVGVFTSKNAVTAAVSSIPFFLSRAVVGCVYVLLQNPGTELWYIIKNAALPELAFNVTAVFFVYAVTSFLHKRVIRRFAI